MKTQEERLALMRADANKAMYANIVQFESALGRKMTDNEQKLYALAFRTGFNVSIYETIDKVSCNREERDELSRRYFEYLEKKEDNKLC